uniref:Gustatory receptor n=1 Tax=Stomoxys calcitrans TaxID=35570 RepID=A0A905STE6_STOCA
MKRSTYWMLATLYYISQLLGILSFCYDPNTQEIYTTKIVTIYCALISIGLFGVIPMIMQIIRNTENVYSQDVHVQISATIVILHIVAILVTVVFNWMKRCEFIDILQEFIALRQSFLSKWPLSLEMEKKFERALRLKTLVGFLANLSLVLGFFDFYNRQLDLDIFAYMYLSVFSILLGVVIAHYYFYIINVNILLGVLNQRLRCILDTSQDLVRKHQSYHRRLGTFAKQLANEVDELALFQRKLQSHVLRLNDMYGVQSICVLLMVYLTNLIVLYMTYMMNQHAYVFEMYKSQLAPMAIATLLFYVDLGIFGFGLLQLLDLVEETSFLLMEHQPCANNLDVELEKS